MSSGDTQPFHPGHRSYSRGGESTRKLPSVREVDFGSEPKPTQSKPAEPIPSSPPRILNDATTDNADDNTEAGSEALDIVNNLSSNPYVNQYNDIEEIVESYNSDSKFSVKKKQSERIHEKEESSKEVPAGNETRGEQDVQRPSMTREKTTFFGEQSLEFRVPGFILRFLEVDTVNRIVRKFKLWYKHEISPFWKIKLAQILCVIYILLLTFSYPPIGIRDPNTNNIIDPASEENTANGVIYVNGDYRPVVAIGGWQQFCLAMSRMSAFSIYPMLVVVFASKMKALQTFFVKTPFSLYINLLNEGHEYHAHAGVYIAFDVWVHTVFHILRWISQGNGDLLWTTNAGISGLIAVLVTPLITFPMMYWKKKISYEIRKGLHYLFFVFAVAMCFHVPVTAIPNGGFIAPILGTCIVVYTLDTAYVYCFMTEKVETTSFHVLSSGVRISMPVSDRFLSHSQRGLRAGYAYVNIPWVDDKQWHPYSLFEDPSDPRIQQMFLMKVGDWTGDVHKALLRDTKRPCWIKGPFPSPYSHAGKYDNQILVASGIGITPALAAINAFKAQRRINLIWACRDPEMLEFFLNQMYLEHDGWNLIFYTGKKPLKEEIEKKQTNIRIIMGRPDLASVIPNIIYGIESGEGLPEKYTARSLDEMKRLVVERSAELEKITTMTATQKIFQLTDYVESLGFCFSEIAEELMLSNAGSNSESTANYADKNSEAEAMMSRLKSSRGMSDLSNSITSQSSFSAKRRQSRAMKLVKRQSTANWESIGETFSRRQSNEVFRPSFKPWIKSQFQENEVKEYDIDVVMSTWAMMYCGGSQPVIDTLSEISMDYHMDLHIDSFSW
ncbi:hypothetical protein ACHAXS_005802 [Conticribra weissflogii]